MALCAAQHAQHRAPLIVAQQLAAGHCTQHGRLGVAVAPMHNERLWPRAVDCWLVSGFRKRHAGLTVRLAFGLFQFPVGLCFITNSAIEFAAAPGAVLLPNETKENHQGC